MHWILFVIWALSIVGVIFVERKNPQETMLWALILVCMPYVGVLLYLAFGKTPGSKLTGAVRTLRFSSDWRKQMEEKSTFHVAEAEVPLTELETRVCRFNKNYNSAPLVAAKDYELLTDGQSHYRRLFEDIESAKESVHVLFYTVHNDEAGHALVDLLTKKAKEGVTVWLMIDFLANVSSPPKMFRPLIEAGGRMRRLKPFLHHFRSHRKIVVVDGTVGYLGGMNIGDKYLGKDKVKTPWRDTQVRVTGSCVSELERRFLTDWLNAISQKQEAEVTEALERLEKRLTNAGTIPCQIVSGGAESDQQRIKMAYLSMISNARERIRIQSPYFVPDTTILEALRAAAATGVKIDLMIPAVKSSFFLEPVTVHYCKELLDVGARVFRYHGYLHAKTMTVDEEICCIGSVNMDMRSLSVDDEVCGVFYDEEMTRRHIEQFRKDKERCVGYTQLDYEKRSILSRVGEQVLLLFAPLM